MTNYLPPEDHVFVRFERGEATWYACVAGAVVARQLGQQGRRTGRAAG